MPSTTFEQFCVDLCALVDVPPPELGDEAQGERGFTIGLGGAEVSFRDGALGHLAAVMMSTRFGAPPADMESEVLRALMDANHELAGIGSPAFVRDPANGEISLVSTILLSDVDVQAVYASLVRATQAVAEWDETHFLAPAMGMGDSEAMLALSRG
jgi:hypothetical protein